MVEELKSLILNNKKKLLKYPICRMGLFGSYARGTQKAKSDIDILVEYDGGVTLFDQVRLSNDLKRILGHRIDLVTVGALKPRIKASVLAEVKWIEGY